jgi:hypothetical protein
LSILWEESDLVQNLTVEVSRQRLTLEESERGNEEACGLVKTVLIV